VERDDGVVRARADVPAARGRAHRRRHRRGGRIAARPLDPRRLLPARASRHGVRRSTRSAFRSAPRSGSSRAVGWPRRSGGAPRSCSSACPASRWR
jgi:hypothetical protein